MEMLILEINKPKIELPNMASFAYIVVRIEMNRTFNHSVISITRSLPTGEVHRQQINNLPFKISRKSNYTEYSRGFALLTPGNIYSVEISKFKKGDIVKVFFIKKAIQLNICKL